MSPAAKKIQRKRQPLTRDRVLRAALKLADSKGIDALTMRKLAQTLRVEAMSLYNHVENKDALLDGLVELVVAEIEVPAKGGDWKAELRKRAHSAHQVLLAHPWASSLMVSRMSVGPAMLRYVDATLGCLREAGFSYAQADHAWNALDSHIYGFTLQELSFPLEPSQYAEAAAHYLPTLPRADFPHLHALTTLVVERKHAGLQDFAFGLELLLDGLERLLRRPTTG